MVKLFAGIEAGGTKVVCAVGDGTGKLQQRTAFPTTTPEETMGKVVSYFKKVAETLPFVALGVASFGPLDPDPNSPYYGYITTTPKRGWNHYNILGALQAEFTVPMGFDTDVNGAALGEIRWGAGQGLHSVIYYTVGTGIGAGGILDGQMMHGLVHPEMGHSFIPHNRERDPFVGVCPYHDDCLEGLASGPSLMKRWGVESALDLPPKHVAWELEAEYLGYALANTVMMVSPQRIIMGGGVMQQHHLFPKIRAKTLEFLGGYIKHKSILEDIENYIVPPALGQNAGICGAIALAEKSYHEAEDGK